MGRCDGKMKLTAANIEEFKAVAREHLRKIACVNCKHGKTWHRTRKEDKSCFLTHCECKAFKLEAALTKPQTRKSEKMKTQTKHTPGPWRVCPMYHVVRAGKNDEKSICQVWDDFGEKQQAANTELIAAAPELLKALKEMCEIERDQDPESRNVHDKTRKQYEELIAKAESKS